MSPTPAEGNISDICYLVTVLKTLDAALKVYFRTTTFPYVAYVCLGTHAHDVFVFVYVCLCINVKNCATSQEGYLGAHFMQSFGNSLARHIAVEDMALQHTRVLVTGHESKIPARRGEPNEQEQGSKH